MTNNRVGLARNVWRFAGLLSLAVLAFGLLQGPSAALAQDARTRARTSFNEGVAAYEAGRYREALASFEQAYRAAPHPAVRVNMANCFEQLGQYVEALFNFRRYLEESGEQVNEEQKKEVEAAIVRLTPKVSTLVLDLSPRNASVTIDGQEPRRTPDGRVQVVAGVHDVRVAAPGYEPSERSVDAKGGADTPVMITLEPEAIDAVPLLDAAEARSVEQATSDDAEPPPSEQSASDRPRRVLLWSGVTLTGLMAVGAGAAGIIALKADADFEDADARSKDPNLSELERFNARNEGLLKADRANNAALMSDVFLGVGAAAGVATLVIWLVGRKHDEGGNDSALAVTPSYARDGAGLRLSGQF